MVNVQLNVFHAIYCNLYSVRHCGLSPTLKAVQQGRAPPSGTPMLGFNFPPEYSSTSSTLSPHPAPATAYLSSYISLLVRAEPCPSTRYPTYAQQPPNLGGIDGVCEFAARLLFSAVEWARNIPGFPELQVTDQVALLSCWTPCFA